MSLQEEIAQQICLSLIGVVGLTESVKDNDMACKRCQISTLTKDNGVDLFLVPEKWLSAQGDEAKTVEFFFFGT